jgi:DNA polymerase III epsilon subunit-like protein
MSDKVIEHFELQQLSDWLQRNIEFGEEIPAITYLWRIVHGALSDDDVQSFEWAMIRAGISKVMPPTAVEAPARYPQSTAITEGTVFKAGSFGTDEWVVIDTETSGLMNPIYAVEIAAQRMKGTAPIGPSFRVFLNHNVDLEPAAVATHGYTRDFLRKKGLSPKEAHRQLAAYAEGRPMASHNLAYDFNRVLRPEWGRLGFAELCPPAFCTVMLARRCLPEASSVSLGSLAKEYRLGDVSHQAAEDVLLTVKLFSEVLAPRLSSAGIREVAAVQKFAKKTPVASCHEVLGGTTPSSEKPLPRKKRTSVKARRLKQFLQEILSDGEISNHEFDALQKWLETEGVASREAERVSELIEGILQDGKVTPDELKKLKDELSVIAG